MATNVIPNDYRTHVGFELITDINTIPENTYYMFMGNHMPNGSTIPSVSDDTNDTMTQAYRNMICGKQIMPSDVSMMIQNIPWASGTAYAMYDDMDTLQGQHNYFAIVNAGAFFHIWKCLDNNMGANSTVTPDISQIDVNDISYRTGDGYLWKYMASTSVANATKFSTTTYFPIVSNTQVTVAAVPGAIDVFAISNTGSGYRNWVTGSFSAGDVRPSGNSVTYAITGNSSTSQISGFYTGCNLYIAGGAGIGQYKTVTDYFSNANGNFVIIDSPFATLPQNGSTYQIYPTVTIIGQGSQTINAAARALINAVGNTVYRVDVLNRGRGYSYAVANVIANTVAAPVYPASVRPIKPPFAGHGYNALEELGATRVSFSVSFANNEANTIPATNQYQQIGIIKNPTFSNVVVNFTSVVGTFLNNETVITYTSRLLQNNVTIAVGSPNVSVSTGILNQQLSSGDPVVFTNGTQYWYSTVNAVTNSSFMTITSTPSWACTVAQMMLVIPGTGTGMLVNLPGANTIELSGVTGSFTTNTYVIGTNSGALGITNNVSRGGTIKGFSTYVGTHKYIATPSSGVFQQNEVVFMSFGGTSVNTATSTASLHSVYTGNGALTMYVSNTVGTFAEDPTGQIKGANSGAVAVLTTKYKPEIRFGSSKVLYLENIAGVVRSDTLTDTINIILTF